MKQVASTTAPGGKGTIGGTFLARKVFNLFRDFMRRPASIRLIILILRQTGEVLTRPINQLLDDLGFDNSHPQRALDELEAAMNRLQLVGIVTEFEINREGDRLRAVINREWHKSNIVRKGTP